MQITDITMDLVRVPLVAPFKLAHSYRTHGESAVVSITTDEGLRGYGNVTPLGATEALFAIEAQITGPIARVLTGADPMQWPEVLARLHGSCDGASYAKAAADTALHDLRAKALGVPLHAMLGSTGATTIPLVGWIGRKGPEETVREAQAWVDQGFKALKVKIGADPSTEESRFRALRGAVGEDFVIRVDANAVYSVDEAINVLSRLADYGLQYCEQPVDGRDIEGLAMVRRSVPVPIAADEAVRSLEDLHAVVEYGAADYLRVKVMNAGGISRTMELIDRAQEAGMPCIIGHGFALGLDALAEAHVAAAASNVLLPGEMVGPLKLADDILDSSPGIQEGALQLPLRPGLGREPDPRKLAAYAVAASHWRPPIAVAL